MPTYIEVNGMDEAGSVGEAIIFVRLGVGLPNEVQLFLRNLYHFNTLMPNKTRLHGYEDGYLLKYATDILDDSTYKIDLYKMPLDVQLKLIKYMTVQTSIDLHLCRKDLLSVFDANGNMRNGASVSPVYKTTDILKRFRDSKIWIESFVKSYGMMYITKELGISSKNREKKLKSEGFSDFFSVSQIAGGYPFAFWWKTLMEQGHFAKGKFIVTGVSNGDVHYPCMSGAGTMASALFRNMDKLHLFPTKIIEYDDSIDLSEFYLGHSNALEMPIFQKRLIFIGRMNENLKMCVPYLAHLRDIHYTPEATHVNVPIEWFFKGRGYGNKDNTTIIYCNRLSQRDKENIKFCRDANYPVYHVCEYKKDFEELVSKIENETEYAPSQKRNKLVGILKRVKDVCLKEME
jgi:hypothetical protein